MTDEACIAETPSGVSHNNYPFGGQVTEAIQMITLSRNYFTQKVDEAKEQYLEQETYVHKCKQMGESDEYLEKLLDNYWSKYRSAMINLKRFDLGRLVKVEGLGYISNYSKS